MEDTGGNKIIIKSLCNMNHNLQVFVKCTVIKTSFVDIHSAKLSDSAIKKLKRIEAEYNSNANAGKNSANSLWLSLDHIAILAEWSLGEHLSMW